MSLMIDDLDQCDKERLELTKVKVELIGAQEQIAKHESDKISMKSELARLQNYNDSLIQQNLTLSVDGGKTNAKLKKSRNWWIVTAVGATITAIAVHYHWKEANVND